MKIVGLDEKRLANYVHTQLAHHFPIDNLPEPAFIATYIPKALKRLERCIAEVAMWRPGAFDVLHSTQYCIFIYYLSNTIWLQTGDRTCCTLLFLLNKTLNGIDLFYEIEMPEVFFIGHSVGIVLAKAQYGNYLVLYQNSTVGKNNGTAPVLEERVVMYPNTAVIGRSVVRGGSIIAQGVSVINHDTPGNSMVFQGDSGTVIFKETTRDMFCEYFRS